MTHREEGFFIAVLFVCVIAAVALESALFAFFTVISAFSGGAIGSAPSQVGPRSRRWYCWSMISVYVAVGMFDILATIQGYTVGVLQLRIVGPAASHLTYTISALVFALCAWFTAGRPKLEEVGE